MLSAVAEHYGIQSNLIPAIATGFCGGIARTSNLCGAVAGGVMAINLRAGRAKADVPVEPCYALTRLFVKEFEATFGSTNCAQLTGCDLGSPEGHQTFREKNLIVHCRRYTVEATRMVLNILEKA